MNKEILDVFKLHFQLRIPACSTVYRATTAYPAICPDSSELFLHIMKSSLPAVLSPAINKCWHHVP